MSFDPTALLDIERRTGVREDDVEDFLRKANAVEEAIKGMVTGSVDPNTIKIPGLESEEEKAQMEAERQKRLEESRRKAEELRLKRKLEERERWWAGAELFLSDRHDRGVGNGLDDDDDDDADGTGNKASALSTSKQAILQRYAADYSRWNEWVPSDPASLQEEAEVKSEEERIKNEEFEKNNKDFCEQFKEDMHERTKSIQKKREDAETLRNKGNRHFKKKEYLPQAMDAYMESLKLQPYDTKTLTNIAQVNIKLGQLDDALDFLGRTLAIEPVHVKALSRQAFVLGEQKQFDPAIKSIKKALKREPQNEDLVLQHRELEIMAKEYGDEAMLKSMMTPLPAMSDDALPKVPAAVVALPSPPPAPNASSSSGNTLREAKSVAQAEMLGDFELADALHSALDGALKSISHSNSELTSDKKPPALILAELLKDLKLRLPILDKTASSDAINHNAFDELAQRIGANSMIKVQARTSGLTLRGIEFCVAVANLLQDNNEPIFAEGQDAASTSLRLLVSELLTSCLHFVTIVIDGERASKLLLVEHAATIPALRTLLNYISQPEILLSATNLLYACCSDDMSKKIQQTILSDRKLVLLLATALGELVSRSRPMCLSDLVAAATTASNVRNTSKATENKNPPSLSERDSEERTISTCKACIGIALLLKEISFSDLGKSTTLANPEVGSAVCALGSMLHMYSSSVLWDAHHAIEVSLEALLGLSQVEVLRNFFALSIPVGPQENQSGGGEAAAVSRSVVQIILEQVLKKQDAENKMTANTAIKSSSSNSNGVSLYTSTSLAVLMNACLDTDGSVRAAVVQHGGMQEALKGLRLGLKASSLTTTNSISTSISIHDSQLLCRQAGLMSRLATVQGVQAVLYEPDNYRLICRGIAKPSVTNGTSDEMSKVDAEGKAHLVRTLAALNQPPVACHAVALQEQLIPALLDLFPRPREELGEITPQSVVLPPHTPASPVLLGNAARCLMPYADDADNALIMFKRRELVGIEKLVNAMASCTDMRVRKNLAILLAKGSRIDGVRDLITHFRGMQMINELFSDPKS